MSEPAKGAVSLLPRIADARRREVFNEAIIEAERGRAYDEGFAAGREACAAGHRRLRVVSGGAA